jgi:hypothetical protein
MLRAAIWVQEIGRNKIREEENKDKGKGGKVEK